MRFHKLKTWQVGASGERWPYIIAHPDSELGNLNYAYAEGMDLIAINPDGLMIYKRRPWWRH